MFRSIAFALAAGLIAVSPAQAGNTETRTHYVRTADLNLTGVSGQATLERRIRSAARSVCRGTGYGGTFARRLEARCTAQAIESTRPQVALLIAAARSGIALNGAVPIG